MSIIDLMLKKRYINDEILFLRSEQEAEMKHDDEKPPTFLLYSDCFAPLLRVARTDWKPLLWNAALALKSSKSASYLKGSALCRRPLGLAQWLGGSVAWWLSGLAARWIGRLVPWWLGGLVAQ